MVTDTFVHTHGSFITTDSFGAGHAGDIRIHADILRLEDLALIASGAFASGNADNITAEATQIVITGGAGIDSSTFNRGQGGVVTVRASEIVLLAGTTDDGLISSTISAQAEDVGQAGSVLVEGQTVMLTGGATINSIALGPGNGGSVTVRASGAVILVGTNPDRSFPSSISSSSVGLTGPRSGNGGRILVEAQRVEITEGAQITSETLSIGHGGTITIRATDTVIVDGTDEAGIPGVPNLPSAISTNSLGTESGSGDGGTIVVEARMVVLTDGAEISRETVGSGDGGTVIVRAQDAVLLSGASLDGFIPSGIVASTLSHDDNSGNAGTIEIEADTVHLSGGAHIRTNTRGSGRGGARVRDGSGGGHP